MATTMLKGSLSTSNARAFSSATQCRGIRRSISRSNSLRVHAVLTADVGKTLDVSKMAPLGDRLLVKPQEKESKSAGGILLTATSNNSIGEDSFVGTILAVGDEVELEGVKVGDRVLFSKYGSSNIEVPGGEVCFVQQRSVMAKLS